jgi:glycosyltransferase involved in cell wall biosynthesis
MCTFNGASYLEEQLNSFTLQSRPPDELVVCDDGSQDSTLEILDTFSKQAPFPVRVYRNPARIGYVRNFEQAIRRCDGELIALSDQDDIWYPNKLSLLCAALERDDVVGGAFSNGNLIDSHSRLVRGNLWRNFKFNAKEQERFQSADALGVLLRRNVVTGMTLAFRSDLREKLLPIPASWEHDSWIAVLLVLSSRLKMLPDRLVQYRIHPQQKIGVPLSSVRKLETIVSRGPSFFWSQARLRNEDLYSRYAKRFEDLGKYLSAAGLGKPEALLEIQARTRYSYDALASLSLPRQKRGKEILRRIDEYRRYSLGGTRAMVRDLLL